MPDPRATLSLFAEIALGRAGFSGIVIALGSRSQGRFTPLERRRLFNLFAFSGLVFGASLFAMTAQHVEALAPAVLWRVGSAVLILTGVPWMVLDRRRIARLTPNERAQIRGYVIYPFTALAVVALLLQAVNLYLGTAWPFYFALVAQRSFTLQQFVLLVWSGIQNADPRSTD